MDFEKVDKLPPRSIKGCGKNQLLVKRFAESKLGVALINLDGKLPRDVKPNLDVAIRRAGYRNIKTVNRGGKLYFVNLDLCGDESLENL